MYTVCTSLPLKEDNHSILMSLFSTALAINFLCVVCYLHVYTWVTGCIISLTRGAVLNCSVIDVVPELFHVSAVSAVDHVHRGADARVGQPVVAATVELLESGLQSCRVVFVATSL